MAEDRSEGIMLFRIIALVHYLVHLYDLVFDETELRQVQCLIDYPVVIKPSWFAALKKNYSRPPNKSPLD